MDPFGMDPTGSFGGLVAVILLVMLIVGSLLATVPAIVDFHLRRHTPLRQFVRVSFAAAYAGAGFWVHRVLASEYTRELAEVDPEGDCLGFNGDNSGCPAWNGPRHWIRLWAAVGLAAAVIARVSAVKAKRRDELLEGSLDQTRA